MKDTKKVVRLLKQISNEFDSKDEHDQLVGFAFATNLAYSQGIFINIAAEGVFFNSVTFAEKGIGDIIAASQSAHQLSRH